MVNRHLRRIHRADEIVFDRSANLSPSGLDRAMRFLSRAADKGLLWWFVAAVLGLVGGRARRGGVRGLLSLMMASGLANGILEPWHWLTDVVRLIHHLLAPFGSSSFSNVTLNV